MTKPNSFTLSQSVILITGGGTGIGKACAQSAAEGGAAHIVLCGRRMEPLSDAVKNLRQHYKGTTFSCVSADITKSEDRVRIVDHIANIGRLDGLVNNAGLFVGESLAETADTSWDHIFAVNVDAPFQLMRDLLPWLKKSGHASVVNISSTLAVKPIPNAAGYNASKAALIQLSRSLALELAPNKIRVNCILPGIVETDMYRDRYPDDASYQEGIQGAASIHPLGRVGQPNDIALATRFLLSNAAEWITGVALPVDGGMLVT
jgi:NAD(P)-dependent dehydrogenase (short-subunit alcohol dehydrogenase family)